MTLSASAGSPFATTTVSPFEDPNTAPDVDADADAAQRATLTVYLPGMFRVQDRRGSYPVVSITGKACHLHCDHCQGQLLTSMLPATSPQALMELGQRFDAKGQPGILISGGCDARGKLPWSEFYEAIATLKATTNLYISVHCGMLTAEEARQLKAAGVDQALIDVVGDDDTYQKIMKLDQGVSHLNTTLEALQLANLPIVPHIVCGLNYGRIQGEPRALVQLRNYQLAQMVFVVLMKLKGVPTNQASPPPPEAVAELIATARHNHPAIPISLGCARPRGQTQLEILALDAGIDRLALPSEEALAHARQMGHQIRFQATCCSVPPVTGTESWEG